MLIDPLISKKSVVHVIRGQIHSLLDSLFQNHVAADLQDPAVRKWRVTFFWNWYQLSENNASTISTHFSPGITLRSI